MIDGLSPLVPLGALSMYAFSEYYGTPGILQAWLQEPYATELPDRAERQCALEINLWLGLNAERVYQPALLAAVREERWQDLQPLTRYMDINTPGNYTSDVPVLVLQGQGDTLIPPEASERLTSRLCDHGTPTKLSQYAGTGHSAITGVGQPEALRWMADRLASLLATDSCTLTPATGLTPVPKPVGGYGQPLSAWALLAPWLVLVMVAAVGIVVAGVPRQH